MISPLFFNLISHVGGMHKEYIGPKMRQVSSNSPQVLQNICQISGNQKGHSGTILDRACPTCLPTKLEPALKFSRKSSDPGEPPPIGYPDLMIHESRAKENGERESTWNHKLPFILLVQEISTTACT